MIIKTPFHGSSFNASRTLVKAEYWCASWNPFSTYYRGSLLSYTEEQSKEMHKSKFKFIF